MYAKLCFQYYIKDVKYCVNKRHICGAFCDSENGNELNLPGCKRKRSQADSAGSYYHAGSQVYF